MRCRDPDWDEIAVATWAPKSDGGRYRLDTQAAMIATRELVHELCERFGVPEVWPSERETLSDARVREPGVYAHGHLSTTRWDGHALLDAWESAA